MNRTIFLPWAAGCLALLLGLSCPNTDLAEPPPDLHKQLKDRSPLVRTKAALTLAEANDADAIPVLIDLLAVLPAADRQPVEECLSKLAGEWAPRLPLSTNDKIDPRSRRDAWASWWRRTDGAFLLAALAQYTLSPDKRRQIQELLPQLGNDDFSVRESASRKLLAFGRLALPQLREAVKDRDLEASQRAKMLIERIENGPDGRLPVAALRLLAVRKPSGAVEALLAYLPFADDEVREEELRKSLVVLARRDGKLDPALRRALADARPKVRALAAESLIEGGGSNGRAAVRKLLREDAPSVRLRAALALARVGEREGVAVLIDLLPLLSADECGQGEETLYQLAGDSLPELPASAPSGDVRKRRDVWAAWWKRNAKHVEMTRLRAPPLLGFTLVLGNDHVYEIDRHGKIRWNIDKLELVSDAVVLPGNRVLMAEWRANRVSERDFKGRILWQTQANQPVCVQRLANGHTFIASDGGLLREVDRNGKDIYVIKNVPKGVRAAYRSRQGSIVCLAGTGECVLMDTTGKRLKTFHTHHAPTDIGTIALSPNGRILVTFQGGDKLVEYDAQGKKLREVNAPRPATATALPNGRFLVASYREHRVFEVDRRGKILWEYKNAGHAYRARRR